MLSGKKIIVAGGGGRIGWKIVLEIIKQGGKVVAIDQQFSDHIYNEIVNDARLKSDVELARVDVCSVNEVREFFQNLSAADGFVNCSYPRGRNYGRDFLNVAVEDFNQTLSMHLGSAVSLTQECVRYFNRDQNWFSVVNFSSIYGVVAPRFEIYSGTTMTTPVEYSLMKSAIQQLNKYVSAYVKNSKFRINTIAPGGILDGQPESFLEGYKKNTRGAGLLASEDVVGAVSFLLSDQSRFISGQNIIVDDGFSL